MKPTFQNSSVREVGRAMWLLERVCLVLSSISSALAIATIIAIVMAPDSSPSTAPFVWVFCGILGICAAYLMDFQLVLKMGSFAVKEVAALLSFRFEFGLLRSGVAFLVLVLALVGLAGSAITSYKGSTIAASMFSRTESHGADYQTKVAEAQRHTRKELEPLAAEITKIEKAAKVDVSTRAGGKLQKLAKDGNDWAKGEIRKIEVAVSKKHAKDLARAKAAYDTRAMALAASEGSVVQGLLSDMTAKVSAQEHKSTGIWLLFLLAGVVPLFAGAIIIIISSLGEVSSQLQKLPKVNRYKAAPTQSKAKSDMEQGFAGMFSENP